MIKKVLIKRYRIRCEKCGHYYITKLFKIPTHCSKCKSRSWNKKNAL